MFIMVVMIRFRVIIIIGLIYFFKCIFEILIFLMNSSGVINVIINNLELKLNLIGMGVRYKIILRKIWINVRGILGMKVCIKEFIIISVINMSRVLNIFIFLFFY